MSQIKYIKCYEPNWGTIPVRTIYRLTFSDPDTLSMPMSWFSHSELYLILILFLSFQFPVIYIEVGKTLHTSITMKTYFIMSNCLFASFTPLAIHQSYINTVFPVILKTFAEWIRFK